MNVVVQHLYLCVHHWIVNEYNFGRCRRCGAERQFPRDPAVDNSPVLSPSRGREPERASPTGEGWERWTE